MPTAQQSAAARHFFFTQRKGVLSTRSQQLEGHPFGSYLPFCHEGPRLLCLLSHLAQHTQNLKADARCALTLVGPSQGNETPRLTLCGQMHLDVPDPLALARYLRYFPEAPDPHFLPDFHLASFEWDNAYWIGGSAQATWLKATDWKTESHWTRHQESAFVHEINTQSGTLLAEAWQRLHSIPASAEVYLLGLDPEGGELRCGSDLLRFAFPHRIQDLTQAWEHLQRQALIDLGAIT